MPYPALEPADVADHHLLVLPGDVGPDEVEVLAVSRFPRAAWERQPSAQAPRPTGGARGLRTGAAPPGALRLSRHSVLVGPFTVDRLTAVTLGVPASAGVAYVVEAPVERGDRPFPHGGDRDGLRRAFPEGLPVRDEERTVTWLIAAARRLGGAVRTGARGGSPATLLVPEPAAAVDLTVWTDIWLEPDAALAVARQALPRAYLNLPTPHWSGPRRHAEPVPGTAPLTPEMRRGLHAAADEHDIRALVEPPPMTGYGALADLDLDGMIALEVAGETRVPPVIAQVPWAAEGAVAYRVRWEPPDLADREHERPPLQHKVARGRATPLVVALTRAVHKAVGGEITDAMEFIVDPADL
ncbi:hypothetical protein ICW40_08110 [Actinotalea ferrariae]|uniref:hypothetical protein n=1 Tax=Actinotalea ferrariae TaxID=1386098 RepID=UPI001C8C5962|nr:hypothetical protein [Actinotalea ferrariae]MBX9244773.1 hypothetical protein [Actinotalea ferrariae]